MNDSVPTMPQQTATTESQPMPNPSAVGARARAKLVASVPLTNPPAWAVAERALFALLDDSWRLFESAFCAPDGSLRYDGKLSSRDGGDDFYESFFNWPQYYLLGGDAAILPASEQHWRALTDQLTRLDIVNNDFEIGYDWFHQGEAMLFMYFLSAAAPVEWRERAARFADLYVDPKNGNYDDVLNIVKAPHNGSGGARKGVSNSEYYPWLADEATKYGFPLDWMEGAPGPHRDFAPDPRLGPEMQQRLGRGDVVANLSISGLVLNAYALTGDDRYSHWIERYVSGWRARATDNGGIIPDNVGLDGVVGSQLEGRTYGGHYGWTWPHGIYSVGQATAVGSMAAAIVSGDLSYLDLARAQYDEVIAHGRTAAFSTSDSSIKHWWGSHLGLDVDTPTLLVPYRRSDKGWFDWNPVQIAVPLALWHFSNDPADLARLRALRERSGFDWRTVRPVREKEEGGHEDAWFTYLEGDNPDYPQSILAAAQYQVRRRLALIETHGNKPVDEADIHIWQLVQPIVTEALTQLTLGGPQVIYNGGQLQTRIRWFDAIGRRAGLPADVAVLVSSIDPKATTVEVVNLSATHDRHVILQAGAYAENQIETVSYDSFVGTWAGSFYEYIGEDIQTTESVAPVGSSYLRIVMPAGTRVRLTLNMTLHAKPQTYLAPWDTSEGIKVVDA
jgi:hypothetical protein